MTAYGIVRTRIKAGREQELFNLIGQQRQPKGLRRNVFVRLGGDRYCSLLEWDSYQALVNGRVEGRKVMDAIRHLLEDMGGDLGVTYPVSGEAIYEFQRPEHTMEPLRLGAPSAWSIIRYSLKRGHDGATETMSRAIAKITASQRTGLRKVVIVKIGERSFCLLSEWDSHRDLVGSSREMIKSLEEFRDMLETVPGGRDLVQSISGEAVFEFSLG
jgi:hypothetical protein